MSMIIKTLKSSRSDVWPDGLILWVYPDGVNYATIQNTQRLVDLDLLTEWCEETFGEPYDRFPSEGVWFRAPNSSDFVFKRKFDAAIFKMRWASH